MILLCFSFRMLLPPASLSCVQITCTTDICHLSMYVMYVCLCLASFGHCPLCLFFDFLFATVCCCFLFCYTACKETRQTKSSVTHIHIYIHALTNIVVAFDCCCCIFVRTQKLNSSQSQFLLLAFDSLLALLLLLLLVRELARCRRRCRCRFVRCVSVFALFDMCMCVCVCVCAYYFDVSFMRQRQSIN